MFVAVANIILLVVLSAGVHAHEAINPLTGQHQAAHDHDHAPKQATPLPLPHNAEQIDPGHHQRPHTMHGMDRNSVQNQELVLI